MVELTFANGSPNESLQVGDLAYYVSNPNTNVGGFITGDNTSGISTYVLIGKVSSIQINDDPDQIQICTTDENGTTTCVDSPITTENTFTVFVEETTSGITPPIQNDYIFFAKSGIVNKSSVLGYYNSVTLKNNSKKKAELFAVACEVNESSK
tara:strand:+ start:5275 stop:5733 length:459 start_codon:yes stop_codon:yes gene_type:complete